MFIKSYIEFNIKFKDFCWFYVNVIFFKIGCVKFLFKNFYCVFMVGYNLLFLEVSCGEKFGSN